MAEKKILLEPGSLYHIFNHSNGKDNLFENKENYRYFLLKYFYHVDFLVDTYSYCLMPNHFHFLILVKDEQEIIKTYRDINSHKEDINENYFLIWIIQQFSNFFNGYAKAFNKINNRKGALFNDSFKRKKVMERDYLFKLIHYIHYNPVHHNFVKNIEDWDFSSYKAIVKNSDSRISRNEVIELFDNLDNFVFYHQQKPDDLKFL